MKHIPNDTVEKLMDEFANPAAEYRPQPFWFLNHTLELDELTRQIEEMHRQGVGGVVLHSRHGKTLEYLSDEYMQSLRHCTEECRRRGMIVWLYDEDNWPSGTLGGKLTRAHPEYRMRYLRVEEKRCRGTKLRQITLDFKQYESNELIAILAYPVIGYDESGTILLSDQPIHLTELWGGVWHFPDHREYIILAFWECEVAELVTFGGGYYLDTMNPEAVAAFRSRGYDPFDQLKDYFRDTIQGVFTDEPGLMIHDGFFGTDAMRTQVKDVQFNLPGFTLAWTSHAMERFRQKKGYDLTERLACLLYRVGNQSHQVRQDYYDCLTEWYIDAYHRALHEWCQSRSLKYIGHTLEEPLWGQARSQGNQVQVLQQFDYPGVDYLTHGIGSKDEPKRILAVKCASSVAHIEGRERVVCEAFGASGHSYSMRQRQLDANFMALLGVNLFIPHAFYYSFAGYRKTDFPPTEFYHAPHWAHYRSFADYIARLSLLGSAGRHDGQVLILSPIRTVYREMFENGQSHRKLDSDAIHSFVSDRMIRYRLDFDYIDECQLEIGEAVDAHLKFPHTGETYRMVVLPGVHVLSESIAEKLTEFVNAGGALIAVGALPRHSKEHEDDPRIIGWTKRLFNEHQPGEWVSAGSGQTLYLPEGVYDAGDGKLLSDQIRSVLGEEGLDEGWDIPEQAREHIFMTRRSIGDTVYTWIFNSMDQPIQLRASLAGEISEWELDTGKITRLSSHELEVFELQSHQMRIVSSRAGKETVKGNIEEMKWTKMDEQSLDHSDWIFEAKDPNVYILDRWELTLNDRKSPLPNTVENHINTYRTSFRIDASMIDQSCGLQLILDDLPQRVPSHVGFLSRRRNMELFLNDQPLPPLEPSVWQDRFYTSVDLTPFLQHGKNTLEIVMNILLEPNHGLRFPVFIIGSFKLNEQHELTAPTGTMTGYWTNHGYPYMSGKGTYTKTFQWTRGQPATDSDRWLLELEDVRETAECWINGVSSGVRLWPPYRWDLTKLLREGQNELRIEAANTLENLYGKNPLPSGIAGSARLIYEKKGK